MTSLLEPPESKQRDQRPYVEAVCSGIETAIEGPASAIEMPEELFGGKLGNQPSLLETTNKILGDAVVHTCPACLLV
jgi:hypothetical protein